MCVCVGGGGSGQGFMSRIMLARAFEEKKGPQPERAKEAQKERHILGLATLGAGLEYQTNHGTYIYLCVNIAVSDGHEGGNGPIE